MKKKRKNPWGSLQITLRRTPKGSLMLSLGEAFLSILPLLPWRNFSFKKKDFSLLILVMAWGSFIFFLTQQAAARFDTSPEKACQFYAAQMEQAYKIPDKLLTAVSLTESGRSMRQGLVPWPWTINVGGEGYYFPTKSAAIQAVRRFQKKGIKSIDVGCMQINLMHHPEAFKNLEEAFDPKTNISYAAKFLKSLKTSHKNWRTAVARYHSATPAYHIPYQKKVLKTWLEEKKKRKNSRAPMTLWSFQNPYPRLTRRGRSVSRFRPPPAPLTVQRVRYSGKRPFSPSYKTSYRGKISSLLPPVKRVPSLKPTGLSAP